MYSRIHSLIAGLALWMGCALMAQAAGDDARKSVINITTYDADGKLLKSGNGFYVGERGEAVALYDLFDGASKAVAIDANGKRHDVSRIIGASDTYDVVRFRVDTEKNDYLTPAPSQGTEGAAVEVVPYSVEKKSRPVAARISSVTTFESYSYYTLDTANEDQYARLPRDRRRRPGRRHRPEKRHEGTPPGSAPSTSAPPRHSAPARSATSAATSRPYTSPPPCPPTRPTPSTTSTCSE